MFVKLKARDKELKEENKKNLSNPNVTLTVKFSWPSSILAIIV